MCPSILADSLHPPSFPLLSATRDTWSIYTMIPTPMPRAYQGYQQARLRIPGTTWRISSPPGGPHSAPRDMGVIRTDIPRQHRDLNNFDNEELALFTEYLESVLDRAGVPQLLQELRKTFKAGKSILKSCTIPSSLLECVYKSLYNDSKVRIRRVKRYLGSKARKVKETFRQVTLSLKNLIHPNIVPLLGALLGHTELTPEWMSGGYLIPYISNNPNADKVSLLIDVAHGINYIHSRDVIHGDLKGSRILVDPIGHARITDFGLATITQDLDSIRNPTSGRDHSVRWIAPELLVNGGIYTKEVDIFSFAGVMIEVFTCAAPFPEKLPHAAVLAISSGARPPRPTDGNLTDRLWELMQQCWDQDAQQRPHALRVECGLNNTSPLKRLIDDSLDLRKRVSLITTIMSDQKELEVVKNLQGYEAQSFVDAVDQLLNHLPTPLQRKCLGVLRKICGHRALIPKSVRIPVCYNQSGTPLYHGGYADVWKGEYNDRPVAIKVMRVFSMSDSEKIASRFCKEVVTWRALRHPNVLSLLGATTDKFPFSTVTEWMENGNINEYIKANPNANRFELLKDISRGLVYIHGQDMIHGDLKGANVLIDEDGHARLADFGLLTLASDPINPTAQSTAAGAGTTRWMSPELLYPEKFGFEESRPTKESDCYALGMVILEVVSGHVPFSPHKEFIVMRMVIEGERPDRPEGKWCTGMLWEIMRSFGAQCSEAWASMRSDFLIEPLQAA